MSAVGSPERQARYERLLDQIGEGVRLHYPPASAPTPPVDPDFDLLEGDRAYADGLLALAELGDLEATRILGEAISAIAAAHADGDPAIAEFQWEQARTAILARA